MVATLLPSNSSQPTNYLSRACCVGWGSSQKVNCLPWLSPADSAVTNWCRQPSQSLSLSLSLSLPDETIGVCSTLMCTNANMKRIFIKELFPKMRFSTLKKKSRRVSIRECSKKVLHKGERRESFFFFFCLTLKAAISLLSGEARTNRTDEEDSGQCWREGGGGGEGEGERNPYLSPLKRLERLFFFFFINCLLMAAEHFQFPSPPS